MTREAIERQAREALEAAFVSDEALALRAMREVTGAEIFWWHKLTIPQLRGLIAVLNGGEYRPPAAEAPIQP